MDEASSSTTDANTEQAPPPKKEKKKNLPPPSSDGPAVEYAQIDLKAMASIEELIALPMDHLKQECVRRGLKCGGSAQERAERLWTIKDLKPKKYPKQMLAKK